MRPFVFTLSATVFLLFSGPDASAADGDPMALRSWPDSVVTIETHWGHKLAITPASLRQQSDQSTVDRSVAIGETVDHVLTRLPNQAKVRWIPAVELKSDDPNKIKVRSFKASGGDAFSVTADGLGILVVGAGSEAQSERQDDWPRDLDEVDVLVFLTARPDEPSSLTTEMAAKWVQVTRPRTVVVPVASNLKIPLDASEQIELDHNTLALSAVGSPATGTVWVRLGSKPWKMPTELAERFTAMEKACRQSQAVFEKLSVEQLNFRPSNGTHTPRWNAEHMMGRQLLFFSQIYHEIDPTIPVMDLNPKQMPPDYVAAHPDWDGPEEARQMQRVSEFCRRFAYLLDGIGLSEKAPGSRWPTLGALLDQMQRHYDEHTANTIKKFDLPDWPEG